MGYYWNRPSNLLQQVLSQQGTTRVLFSLWHVFKKFCIFQNILKRTSPGSRDEDTATKAFNELKKVVIIIRNSHLDKYQYYHWRGSTVITMLMCVFLDHQRM